jgi:hypothetical protein
MGNKNNNKNDGKNKGNDSGKKDQKAWKQNSVSLPGTSGHRIWLNKDGGIAGLDKDIKDSWTNPDEGFGWRYNRQATNKSAQKINDYLERSGNTLRGDKGAPIIGFKEVHLERTATGGVPWMWAPGNAMSSGELPGGKEYVAIYAGKVKKDGGKKDGGKKDGGGEESGGGGESWRPSSDDLTGGGASERPVRSTVDVPEIQDWNIEEQIAEQDAAAIAEQAAEQALFENVLQSTSNANYSPAITYSPSTAVNPNPSAWENVLSAWDI